MSLEVGQVLDGKYRIKRLIGEGGMGAVYEGENVRIQRRVAIKVVHAAYAADSGVMARFQREAQAAGRIGNDHILEVLDLGALPDDSQYMVLEFLDGEPLSSRIERLKRLTPAQLAPLALQMLKGLGAAHGAGIFHRDLKPDNIFILKEKAGRADFVKIIDFGISKFQPLSGDGMKMTSTGAVMGTPYYMSPEQASGSREVDARSDLYSMGVILYECVTGRIPFDGDTFNQLMFKIVLSDAPPPQEIVPDLDPAFASIVVKAMARDVSQRFQTADEFGRAIAAWLDRGASVAPVEPPRPSEAAALGAARSAIASASGAHALPRNVASQTGPGPSAQGRSTGGAAGRNTGGAAGGGDTGGAAGQSAGGGAGRNTGGATGRTWATSQFGAPAPRHTVLIASIAGGLALFAIVVVAIVHSRGASPPPVAADSAAAPAPPKVPAAVPVPPPSEVPEPLPTKPAAAAPPVEGSPPVVAPVAPKERPSAPIASKPRVGAKPASGAAPAPKKAPGAAPSPAGGEPYFGY